MMSVLFYSTFNDTIEDLAQGTAGAPTVALDAANFKPFKNGKRGVYFASGDLTRIGYTFDHPHPTHYAMGCKVKTVAALEAGSSTMCLIEHVYNAGRATCKYKAGFATGSDYLYAGAWGADGSILNTLVTFLTSANDEFTLGYQAFPDPDDPTGQIISRLYINGYCIASQMEPAGDYPATPLDKLFIGATAGAVSEAFEGVAVRDFWIMDTYETGPLHDYQFLRVHEEDFDINAINDTTVYHDDYQIIGYNRTELDYAVESVNDGRLWGHGLLTDADKVYYTDDATGASGWTKFGDDLAAAARSVYAVGDYVFASVEGTVYRAAIATGTWSDVLTLTDASTYITAGQRGWTHYYDAVNDKTYIVCGEYRASVDERKIYITDDFGETWSTIYTSGTSGIEHIHGVFYTSGGRLWACRGDTADNVGYSDNHGTDWTWLQDEDDHGSGRQFVNFAESSNRIFMGIDSTDGGSLCVAFPKDLAEVVSNYDDDSWDNSWYYVGQAGGLYAGPGWAMVPLDNDFVLIYQWYHNESGQHSSIYVCDRTGTVCLRAEDLGADYEIPAWQTATAKSSERAFIGNMAFPLNVHIRGGALWRRSMFFMLPKRRKYALSE